MKYHCLHGLTENTMSIPYLDSDYLLVIAISVIFVPDLFFVGDMRRCIINACCPVQGACDGTRGLND